MASDKKSANEKSAVAPVPSPPSIGVIRGGPEPSFFKPLHSAMERNKVLEFAGYAQLATLSAATGFPSVRTVRMRAALKDWRAVMFSTDARSAKIQIRICPPRAPTLVRSRPHFLSLALYCGA